MTEPAREQELHNSSWKSLKRILGAIPPKIYMVPAIIIGFALILSWFHEREMAKDRSDVIFRLDMTAKGCPASKGKIAEIISDGQVTSHEIDVLEALTLNEQAKPGGLRTCLTPIWNHSERRWEPSEESAR